MGKAAKKPIKVRLVKNNVPENYPAALEYISRHEHLPKFKIETVRPNNPEGLITALTERTKSLDLIVVSDNILTLNGHDGLKAIAKYGTDMKVPYVLLTGDFTITNETGIDFRDFPLYYSRRSRDLKYKSVARDMHTFATVLDLRVTGPMLKYVQAVIGKVNTFGDYAEATRRVADRDFLGNGMYRSSDRWVTQSFENASHQTTALSSYWKVIDEMPEQRQYQELLASGKPVDRSLRYSPDVRKYLE